MEPLARASRSACRADARRMIVRPFDEADPESLGQIKDYLHSRSRGVEPSPPLAEAWEGFYGYYDRRIRTFLKKWALSEADRNDCVQDVWQEVVARLARFGHDLGRARLSTWMMTLVRNKAVDVIRERSRHALESLGDGQWAAAMDPGPDPAATYERRRAQSHVRDALAQLSGQVSPTSFRVFYLRWIEGRPAAEVAAHLALTPEQVRFRACRMKRKVRELLERSMGPDALDGDLAPRE